MKKKYYALAIPLLLIIASSCTTSRQLNYFKNLPDSTVVNLPPTIVEERKIEKGDELLISIDARDPEAAGFFNRNVSSGGTTTATVTPGVSTPGYVVDPEGNIELPVLGKINVFGLTARQLKDMLVYKVSPYVKAPLINVGFSTFRVTVLGEVRGPGSFSLPLQRTTLFEALAAAGDLPHSARRYNVSLYRDYDGQRTITKLDLRDKNILYNPDVFQLKPNDVLYVQTRPGSVFREDFGLFTSVFTLLVGLVTLGVTISNSQ